MNASKLKRLFMAALTILLSAIANAAPATLSIEKFTINAGETKEMLIDLNNPSDEITSVQFDMILPTGLSIAMEDGEMAIDIAGRTTWKKHSLNANELSKGKIRFLLSSGTNAAVSGTSGALISIKLTAASGFKGGDIKLVDQLLVTPAAAETKPTDYTYTIAAAPKDDVTLTAKSYTRVYGDDNPTFEYTVSGGSITSGTPKLNCSATKTSPVGTYDIVIEKGTVSNNTVNLVKGTLTITKAPLTISAGNYTKVEGEDNPTFTPTFSGFKNSETKTVLTKQPTVTTTATKESPAGSYTVTVSGAEAQNYDITYQNGTLTVTAKPAEQKDNISFTHSLVKTICVQNWDTDGDGELSKEEAAAVKSLGTVFRGQQITMFDELQYFTGLTAIDDNAFNNCYLLTTIKLPSTIQKIGENAFTDCRELYNLEIPTATTEIGQSALAGCKFLSVTVASGNKMFVAEDMMLYQKDKYGQQIETLFWCSPLKEGSPAINSAVTALADNCFYQCTYIKSVELPQSVKTLGSGVFVKCANLENVSMGQNVETIGEGCFNATPKLLSIKVNAQNPYYAFDGGVLIKRQGDVLVAYPSAKGQSYVVPEYIKTIGKWAFYYTAIASVTLPEGLTSIEDYAFYDCKNLVEITCNAETVPTIATRTFDTATYQRAKLIVPAGMRAQYQAAEGWKAFVKIEELSTGLSPIISDATGNNGYYTLDGRKLESLPAKKGIYVVNGQKVVVK